MRLFQGQRAYRPSTRPGVSGWIVLLCVVLLALLAMAQVAHVHLTEVNPSHCPICMLLQTAAPAASAAAAIVLVLLGARLPHYERVAVRSVHRSRLYIRPPPRER